MGAHRELTQTGHESKEAILKITHKTPNRDSEWGQGRIFLNTCSNTYVKLLHTRTEYLPISKDTPLLGYTAHQFLQ